MPDPVEEFFAGYSPDMQAISRELRALLQRAMPGAHEVLVARHNHVSYLSTPAPRDQIFYICPMKDYVRLGFMYGGYLPDPEQMLEGAGARMRHIKVRTLEQARHPAVQALVAAAWADAATRM